MDRKATAVWQGGLKDGKGRISTASGVLKDAQYSFTSRFEEGIGTNPEELVGGAHAGCFSMALSAILGESGMKPESVETTATVTLRNVDDAPTVTNIHLDVKAKVPGATEQQFLEAAEAAKMNCPISRLLKAEISMTAKLLD
jgi:osmotically inducible protein OsmC